MNSIKTYTNSKGESLPKVICAVVEFEKARLKDTDSRISLASTFVWNKSNIFGQDSQGNYHKWDSIYKGNYEDFYEVFPTCKNSRGQELPEEIQVEIVEERLRQGINETKVFSGTFFDWDISEKGYDYWNEIYHHTNYNDFLPTQSEPTKSDDTFTQGEIVEVSDDNFASKDNLEFVCYDKSKGYYVCRNNDDFGYYYSGWKFCRKIQPLELTLPELLTIAEEVKRTKVKLKS